MTSTPARAIGTTAPSVSNGRRTSGFTLIEVVAVVVVLAILAGISIPLYLNQRQKSRVASVTADTKNLGALIEDSWGSSRAYPVELDSLATQIPGARLSDRSRVAQYARITDGFTLCVIYLEGTTTKAYARYDSTSGGIVAKGNGTGGAACTPTATDVGLGGNNPTATPTTPVPTTPPPPPPTSTPNTDWPSENGADIGVPDNLIAISPAGQSYADVSWDDAAWADGYALFLDGNTTPVWTINDNTVDMTRTRLTSLTPGYHEVTVAATRENDHGARSQPFGFTVYGDNDSLVHAHPINVRDFDTSWSSRNYTNTAATTEPNEDPALGTRSMWWTWNSTISGTATINVIKPSNAVRFSNPALNVWTSSTTDMAALMATPSTGGANISTVTIPIVSGRTYTIRVGSSLNNTGGFQVNVRTGPANDNLANAATVGELAAGAWTSEDYSNANAGTEAGESNTNATKSVWWRWIAPAGGTYKISVIDPMFGTHFDSPTMNVWKSNTTSMATLMGQPSQGGSNLTTVTVTVTAGQTVVWRVAAPSGALSGGSFRTQVTVGP